jgi:hypothetical protein
MVYDMIDDVFLSTSSVHYLHSKSEKCSYNSRWSDHHDFRHDQKLETRHVEGCELRRRDGGAPD